MLRSKEEGQDAAALRGKEEVKQEPNWSHSQGPLPIPLKRIILSTTSS